MREEKAKIVTPVLSDPTLPDPRLVGDAPRIGSSENSNGSSFDPDPFISRYKPISKRRLSILTTNTLCVAIKS